MRVFSLFLISLFSLQCYSQQNPKLNLPESIARGKDIYIAQCLTCHLDMGEGIEDVYPPLAKADYLMADKKRSIEQVLYGAKGEMKVN